MEICARWREAEGIGERMKKRLWIAGLCSLLLLSGGCGSQGEGNRVQEDLAQVKESGENQESVTFLDDLGREVTVCSPRRTAALIGSFADIWLLSGGELAAAANDSWDSLALGLGPEVVNLGSIQEPDVEQLIAANPDFVLASVNTDADLALMDILEQAEIPVAYFGVSGFEEYLHMLDICTQITGRRDLYEENGTDSGDGQKG